MEVKHKNYKEDFKLLISLGSAYGGEEFALTFSSGKYGIKTYVCAYKDGVYTNCEMADDTHLLCKFDNHGLPCGLLMCDCKVCLPDTSMADGDFALDSRALVEFQIDNISYHLELTNGKSDIIETVEATFELLGTILRGDPGKDGLTTKVKVNGTTYEQIDGLIDLGEIAGGSGKVKDVTVNGESVLDEDTGIAKVTTPTKTSELTNDSGFINDISSKQDVIDDLDTIRSGASAGATAVQPSAIADMETKTNVSATYATKTELESAESRITTLETDKADVIEVLTAVAADDTTLTSIDKLADNILA